MSSADEIATRLQTFLTDLGHSCQATVTGRATVGLSQDTWFARVVGADGSAEEVVVRLPTGASGHKSILTQRAALEAVAGTTVPAPQVRWSDDSVDNPFATPVIVMERLDGSVPAGWHELPETRRAALARRTMEAMAALHALRPEHAPDLRRPRETPAEDALAFHRRRLEQLGFGEDPVVRAALWWLQRHLPETRPRAIVHHDLRMGNLVVEQDELVGVLDWELAAIGDPHTDVVWCFAAVWEPSGVDAPRMYDHYVAAGGAELDDRLLHWELVMAYLRLTYYAASGATAFRTGVSDDLRLAALAFHMPVQLERLTAAIVGDPIR